MTVHEEFFSLNHKRILKVQPHGRMVDWFECSEQSVELSLSCRYQSNPGSCTGGPKNCRCRASANPCGRHSEHFDHTSLGEGLL